MPFNSLKSKLKHFKRPDQQNDTLNQPQVIQGHADITYAAVQLSKNHAQRDRSLQTPYHLNQRGAQADLKGPGENTAQHSGLFCGADNCTLNNPVMIDAKHINKFITYINDGKPVFDRLEPYTTLDAAFDSEARYPPPLCHPGTRSLLQANLESWLVDDQRQWKVIWLHGPAGVGKSAVAQTFAQHCHMENRLGATFFFSRLNKRSDPRRVIPTLAYSLAVNYKEYRNLLADQLLNNPSILGKAMHVQLRELIIEPFSKLYARDSSDFRHPCLIILDGLDECQGQDAQCKIVDMIVEIIRAKKELPLLWLICSRPESHLRYTFSKADSEIKCGREVIAIDDKAREEVDQYLRDGFREVREKFSYIASPSWPSKKQFAQVSRAASGLFIVAATVLKYVGDPARANPPDRLITVLSHLKNAHDTGQSPWETLDLLYTQILSDIPDDVFPITRRILLHLLYMPSFVDSVKLEATQTLCNFLCFDQSTFYCALQKLHSVVDVPPPEAAATAPLRFYHASFGDYLRNPIRSEKFVVEQQQALVEIARSCLYWHEIDSALFHTRNNSMPHPWLARPYDAFPSLKWASGGGVERVFHDIAGFTRKNWCEACAPRSSRPLPPTPIVEFCDPVAKYFRQSGKLRTELDQPQGDEHDLNSSHIRDNVRQTEFKLAIEGRSPDQYTRTGLNESRNTEIQFQRSGPFHDSHDSIPQLNKFLSSRGPVPHYLSPYITPNAGADTCARYPPPLCHPSTRQQIGNSLNNWMLDSCRQWNMIWLSEPVGVDKSAVAQAFAERCIERGRLGAAFFFSRQNHRDDPKCVIPTLAYQLAVSFPEYKALLANQVADDPNVMEATIRMQFRKLIFEPFSILRIRQPRQVQEPLVIILDGLDECQGQDAQCEIVRAIIEATRRDLPLLWLICSRPEPHLRSIFSEIDSMV